MWMNAKSTLDTLNTLVRHVFRTFYPEHFIVVSELVRNTEFVSADQIAARLNLTEQLVNKSLSDLRQKRFLQEVKYGDVPTFFGFDYHAFVNIVRFKMVKLKEREAEKSAGSSSGAAAGGYSCRVCGRELSWEQFVRLAGAGAAPKCQARGCGGELVKESKRAAEGLKPLEVVSKALQRLEGQEIPTLGRRTMNARIEEAARREDEERPEGGPKYEMPVLGPVKTKYFIEFEEAKKMQNRPLAPPELQSLAIDSDEATKRRFVPPPWLLPAKEEGENESKQKEVIDVDRREVVLPSRHLPLAEALTVYPVELVSQLDALQREQHRYDEPRSSPSNRTVIVGGVAVPLSGVTNDHVLAMTAEEYEAYFLLYQEECDARLKELFMF